MCGGVMCFGVKGGGCGSCFLILCLKSEKDEEEKVRREERKKWEERRKKWEERREKERRGKRGERRVEEILMAFVFISSE
jgi:hypothetical protein